MEEETEQTGILSAQATVETTPAPPEHAPALPPPPIPPSWPLPPTDAVPAPPSFSSADPISAPPDLSSIPEGPTPGPEKRRSWLAVAVVAALVGGLVGAGVTALSDNHNGNNNFTIHESNAAPGAAMLSGNVSIPATR